MTRKRGTYRLVQTGEYMGHKWYLFEIPGESLTRFIAYYSWFWHGHDVYLPLDPA